MKPASIFACTLLVALAGNAASAQQMIPPGASQFSPPPPAPPPSPKIEVPVVPQLGAPPRQNFQAAPRASFGDRVETCLDEGAAAGLNPGDRAAYSRSCANQ
jgi:hypothetical protein